LKLKNIELINKQTREIDNAKRTIVEKELKLKKEMVSNLSIFLNLKSETEKAFLKNIKDLKRKKDQDPESIFRELQTSVISLMNLDKANLEILSTIEQENTDLIEEIHIKFPFLNKLECQLCSYFRLGLNSKEISSITNLTPGTIRVYKVKIKQKLNLNEDQNLNEFLQSQEEFLK
jgi:DNA-binding NarL/FixJ family response regulator